MENHINYYSFNGNLEPADAMEKLNMPNSAVYEVIKMVGAKPLFFEEHMLRFTNSLKNMGYTMSITQEEILKEILVLSRVNVMKDADVQMVYIPKGDREFDFLVSFLESIEISSSARQQGVIVETISMERNNPNIKTMGTSYKNKVQSVAKNTETFEILLVNSEGLITEGSRSNVFFVKGNKIITSPAQNVLLGVTRKYIINLCEKNGIELEYASIKEEDIPFMEGAFLSGTTVDILPIHRINDVVFPEINHVVTILKDGYAGLMKDYLDNFEVK